MDPISPARLIAQIVVVAILFLFAWWKPTPRLSILAMCVGGMIGYGLIQDQITARLSLEYFTLAHPRVFDSDEPTWHGLVWGFLGGWPGGLFLGLALAFTATLGHWPTFGPSQLRTPLLILFLCQGFSTALTGFVAWTNYDKIGIDFVGDWAKVIPGEHRRGFFTVACAHMATYSVATVGSVILCGWVAWKRRSS